MLFGYKRTSGLNTVIAGLQLNLPFQPQSGSDRGGRSGRDRGGDAFAPPEPRPARRSSRCFGEYEQKRELVEQILPGMRAQAAETSRIADAVYREGASDLFTCWMPNASGFRPRPFISTPPRLSSSGDRVAAALGLRHEISHFHLFSGSILAAFASRHEPAVEARPTPDKRQFRRGCATQKQLGHGGSPRGGSAISGPITATGQFQINEDNTWQVGAVMEGRIVGVPVHLGELVGPAKWSHGCTVTRSTTRGPAGDRPWPNWIVLR